MLPTMTLLAQHSCVVLPAGGVKLPLERAMLGMPELLVVLAIIVVLFGATKLPQLGKGLGEAIGNFKKAQREAERENSGEIDATPRADAKLEKDDHHA